MLKELYLLLKKDQILILFKVSPLNKEYLEIKLKMGPIRDTVLHQVCLLLKNDLVDKPPELRVSPRAPGKLDASEFQLEPLQ